MSLNLTNQFLIAMPGMHDPNFQQTVTLVCAHNEDGAMGIVIAATALRLARFNSRSSDQDGRRRLDHQR